MIMIIKTIENDDVADDEDDDRDDGHQGFSQDLYSWLSF